MRFRGFAQKFIDSMQWSPEATDSEKTLVISNVNGFEAFIEAHLADPENYVAWLRFDRGAIRVCNSDAPGAFKVYRHPEVTQ